MSPRFVLHKNDLPADVVASMGDVLAIDGEFMGLNVRRDRLCLLQIYDGKPESKVHLVQFERGVYNAPNLKKLMGDQKKQKLFFYARGDMAWISTYIGVLPENVYCLRIASRIARTYTQAHDLEDVCKHMLGVRISKEQQCTDWGRADFSKEQLEYACNDVLFLHALQEKLHAQMAREGRVEIAEGLFTCLPALVRADLAGWNKEDIFAYLIENK